MSERRGNPIFKSNSRCAQLINLSTIPPRLQERNESSCPQRFNKAPQADYLSDIFRTRTFGSHSMNGSQHMSLGPLP